jgi:hypothetical protein
VIFNVTLATVTLIEPVPLFLPDLILRGRWDGFAFCCRTSEEGGPCRSKKFVSGWHSEALTVHANAQDWLEAAAKEKEAG